MIEQEHIKKFLLVSIIPRTMSDESAFKEMKELSSLVETYGGVVEEIVTQRREVHDKGLYIGRGKIDEVAEIIHSLDIDVVVLNAIVKPSHIYEITSMLEKAKREIQVWDRADLILKIFAQHAHTAEAKLQIEIAAMRHMGPRIYGMGHEMSQQGGGIGTLGIGETNTELMKRHWRNQMKIVQDKLKKLSTDRKLQLERRVKIGLKTVSLIGYTNAGKSSLFNLLTGKENTVQNALFVTLDSSVGKLVHSSIQEHVLVSDTIGFIQNLPAELIEAFKSTLMETVHADTLLHVIDISDEDYEQKINVVNDIVLDMGLAKKKQLYVFNKIDAVGTLDKTLLTQKFKQFSPQFISVRKQQGIDNLVSAIQDALSS